MTAIATLTMNPALDVSTSTDKIIPTHKLRCAPPRRDAGGGGINVAREIRALGGEATAVFPSGGAAGQQIEALLRGAGVAFKAIPIAGETRESLTVDEIATGKQYRFVLPGPKLSAKEQERILDCFRHQRADYLVVSGSLPPGVGSDFYARLGELHRDGGRLVLDSSGDVLRTAAEAGAWLIKPSLRELEELAGGALSDAAAIEAAARELIREGLAEVVVVSEGENGATWVTADAAEHIAAIPVKPVSAVGAGDAMVAGITLGAARGLPLEQAVRYGVAAGAATLLGTGTEQLKREDAERLYKQASGRA